MQHEQRTISARTMRRVDELLAQAYGRKRRKRGDPLDGLIRTILSQNTTDNTSLPAFQALKERFPTWEEALAARPRDLAVPMQPAGLAPTKSRRIHQILRQLKQERGELSLAHVCDMSPEQAQDYLLGFEGVGHKTVAIVLLFHCGMPLFPVDTHVFRVARRLGWLPEKSTPEQAHELLTGRVPDELHYQLHLNLVQHGRDACHPRKPACPDCIIRRFCRAYRSGPL